MTRVAVLDDYQHSAHDLANWSSLGSEVEVRFFHEPMDEGSLVRELRDFEILSLMRERTAFPRRVFERLPNLQYVITTGMRNAAVDDAYLREKAISYSGTGQPQRGTVRPVGIGSTAEVAWALILASVKRTVFEDAAMRAGNWQVAFPTNLAGMTLGLAGLGRLGGDMVGPALAFGMDVIAWSQNLTDERAEELGVEKVTKEELLRRCDVLSIHLVLSDRTRGLFAEPELRLMKHSALVINTSRGPIVDESALVDALRSGQIAGAGLDVFDKEPIAHDHPLLSLGNVVLSPHLGYVSESGLRDWYGQVVENIAAFLKGQPIRLIG